MTTDHDDDGHLRSLSEVVRAGERRASLEALRDHLAATLQLYAEPGQVAALAKQLQAVLAELDAMSTTREATALDDLSARRAARRAGGGTGTQG